MKKLLLAGLAALSMASASAETIKFDSLEQAGTDITEVSFYVEQGFVLDSMFMFNAQQQHESYLGSAAMFNLSHSGIVYLTEMDELSSLFNFNSIDLAPLAPATTGGDVLFTGYFGNGTTVQQTVTIDSAFAFSTFQLQGFDGVKSVSWRNDSGFQFQFDNIVANQPSQVPEPGSLALLGLGLIGAAAARRKVVAARKV